MNVLVVDDNATNRMLICMMSEDLGWSCSEAASGSEAIAKLPLQPIDVMLLDISMPGMSGDEVCRHIKSDPHLPQPRIVAFTAHVFPDEIKTIMSAGFDAFLFKPFTEEQLRQVVLNTAG